MDVAKRLLTAAALPVWLALLAGCGEFGQVDQGIAVGYDEAAGTVTLITDSNPAEPGQPRYNVLPPKTVAIPRDPAQMGPVPKPGLQIDLDTAAGELVVYDPSAGSLRTISFSLVERADHIFPDDPQVQDLPRVDAAAGQVTLYSPRTRELVTITPPAEAFNLPRETWAVGDEVRYYYKDPGQALRMMNVSRTQVH